MKTTKWMAAVAICMLLATSAFAQSKKNVTVEITTSSVCSMCKETVEKALAYEKGVSESNLNVDTKIVTISYNPKKTDVDKLRQAIAAVGYSADNVPAVPAAFDKLPTCCKSSCDHR